MLATKSRRAEISKSRSKNNPFKVKWYPENGEPVGHHLLGSRKACIVNIKSIMHICNGDNVVVLDLSGRAVKAFTLSKDGRQVPMDVL